MGQFPPIGTRDLAHIIKIAKAITVSRAFFDLNPYAPSNLKAPCYRSHENAKKRKYDQRIREVEHASFTPLILSGTGGLDSEATTSYKRLASLLSTKWSQAYSLTIMWLRCRLTFSLLRSSIMCIRGGTFSYDLVIMCL